MDYCDALKQALAPDFAPIPFTTQTDCIPGIIDWMNAWEALGNQDATIMIGHLQQNCLPTEKATPNSLETLQHELHDHHFPAGDSGTDEISGGADFRWLEISAEVASASGEVTNSTLPLVSGEDDEPEPKKRKRFSKSSCNIKKKRRWEMGTENPLPEPTKQVLSEIVSELRRQDPLIVEEPFYGPPERIHMMFTWNENIALLLLAILQDCGSNPFKKILEEFENAMDASCPSRPQRDRSSIRKRLQKLLGGMKQLTEKWSTVRAEAVKVVRRKVMMMNELVSSQDVASRLCELVSLLEDHFQ